MPNNATLSMEQVVEFLKANPESGMKLIQQAESEIAQALPPVILKGKGGAQLITLEFAQVVRVNGQAYRGMKAVKIINRDGTDYVKKTRKKPAGNAPVAGKSRK